MKHVAGRGLVTVTVMVAVGAILSLGNSPVAAGSSAAGSKQELLQTLGSLRTSPSASDRKLMACIERTAHKFVGAKCLRGVPEVIQIVEQPAPVADSFLASLGHPRLDLNLIRTVPLLRPSESVAFFPGNWQSSPPSPQENLGYRRSARRSWAGQGRCSTHERENGACSRDRADQRSSQPAQKR